MTIDVTDLDDMIRGYVVNTINEHYPDIDTSQNSVFDELYVKPIINVARPFVEALSRLELKQNLANAEYLTEDELDEIGEGNYFTSRKQGVAASTLMTLTFTNIPVEDSSYFLRIPAGTTFATGSGIEFQTQSAITLTATDMKNGYNPAKLCYEIDVPVTAVEIGSKYNVFAGEIIFCQTYFSNNLVSCVNRVDVTDGKDKESNVEYAERIREFYLSRQLGTAPGYKRYILDAIEEVTDVYVSGYRDEFMTRDLLPVWEESTESVKYMHVGGKVDLHIKGCIYDQDSEEIILNNNVILLDCDFDNLHNKSLPGDNIEIFNLTDSSKVPAIKSVTKVEGDEFGSDFNGKTKIIINNDGEVSYSEETVNSMKLIYKYNDNDNVVSEELYFNCGLSKAELSGPVKSIDYMADFNDIPVDDMDNKFDLVKTGIPDTTAEKCLIKLKNMDNYFNGSRITIRYTSNATLRKVKEMLDDEQTRVITTDIVGKEANAVPVNVQFRFKVTNAYRNLDFSIFEARVKSSIISFFNGYKMGDSVEESDIVGWLYKDASVKDIIQYVELPFKVFYIPESITENIPDDGTQLSDDGVLNIKAIEYPILNAAKFKATPI